jgi:hypothetical protein
LLVVLADDRDSSLGGSGFLGPPAFRGVLSGCGGTVGGRGVSDREEHMSDERNGKPVGENQEGLAVEVDREFVGLGLRLELIAAEWGALNRMRSDLARAAGDLTVVDEAEDALAAEATECLSRYQELRSIVATELVSAVELRRPVIRVEVEQRICRMEREGFAKAFRKALQEDPDLIAARRRMATKQTSAPQGPVLHRPTGRTPRSSRARTSASARGDPSEDDSPRIAREGGQAWLLVDGVALPLGLLSPSWWLHWESDDELRDWLGDGS